MRSYKYLEDVSGGDDWCNHALTEAREAHQQVLEATHILEEKIKWLSWSATGIISTSHWHSHSHGHSRRWSRGCLREPTKTPAGEYHARAPLAISHQENEIGRCFPSPSPTWLRRWVTFQDQQGESLSEEGSSGKHTGQASGRGDTEECDLRSMPALTQSWSLSWGNTHVRWGRGSWPANEALHGKLQWVGGVASLPCWYAGVVGGISCHPQCGEL